MSPIDIKSRFSHDKGSDHYLLNNIFKGWYYAKQDGKDIWKFCRSNMISNSVMEMIEGMRIQVLSQLKKMNLIPFKDQRKVNENSPNWNIVKAAMAFGSYPNLARFDNEANTIRTIKEPKGIFDKPLRQTRLKLSVYRRRNV